ncbi:MAG: response regulator [Elainellaceae cyanobacterium]
MEEYCIHVLLIEDNPGDARLLQELLREVTSVQFELEQVDCLSLGMQRLGERSFDVVLLDLSLPDSQGLETFTALHHGTLDVPVVVITGLNDETLALKAMQQGAQDYLVKGQVNSDLLVRSIRYAIERKRTQQKMQEQAALLDIATDAILVRALDSTILFWNKGAERLYGWKAEAAIGKPVSELLYPANSSQFQAAQMVLLEQGEWYGELEQITQAGQEIVVASHWTLMRDERQQPKSILVVSTDITEKKQLEAQFLRAQRMESIGTLASGIAHDLNNILTPILASAQLLQLKLTTIDERSRQMLRAIEANSKRGAALVQQVLSFARGVEGKHTVLQVKHLIQEIQQILEDTFPQSIAVHIDIPRHLWRVAGNANQLHQVLMNLCVNARDAMPKGGELILIAENLVVDEDLARLTLDAKAGGYVVLTIADTGTGIAPEILDRIFEPFFTTKEVGKGTGLGLSTVVGIIKSHGGYVTVKSVLGEGSQFKVFLPAVNVAEAPEMTNAEVPAGHGEMILIVDDDAAIREINQALLEAYHYRVLVAEDGNEAIAKYVQYQDKIHLVVVDMMMPTVDGAATIQTLQKINPQVKIIAASGLASSNQLRTANLGVNAFLSKPYTFKELINTVDEVLQATSPSSVTK